MRCLGFESARQIVDLQEVPRFPRETRGGQKAQTVNEKRPLYEAFLRTPYPQPPKANSLWQSWQMSRLAPVNGEGGGRQSHDGGVENARLLASLLALLAGGREAVFQGFHRLPISSIPPFSPSVSWTEGDVNQRTRLIRIRGRDLSGNVRLNPGCASSGILRLTDTTSPDAPRPRQTRRPIPARGAGGYRIGFWAGALHPGPRLRHSRIKA
jgi:hypothetical protein